MAGPAPDTPGPPWWHPWRSDPALAGALTLVTHGLAIIGTLVATVLAGLLVGALGLALDAVTDTAGGLVAAAGLLLMMSVMLSWIGHVPGAALLHVLIRRGLGGWGPAMACGLGVSVLIAAAGFWLALAFGPVLAVIHLAVLRAVARWRLTPAGGAGAGR